MPTLSVFRSSRSYSLIQLINSYAPQLIVRYSRFYNRQCLLLSSTKIAFSRSLVLSIALGSIFSPLVLIQLYTLNRLNQKLEPFIIIAITSRSILKLTWFTSERLTQASGSRPTSALTSQCYHSFQLQYIKNCNKLIYSLDLLLLLALLILTVQVWALCLVCLQRLHRLSPRTLFDTLLLSLQLLPTCLANTSYILPIP